MRKIRLNADIIINAVIALNILSLISDLIMDYFYFTDYLPQPLLVIGYTLLFYTVFGMFWSILIAITAAVSQIIKKHRTSRRYTVNVVQLILLISELPFWWYYWFNALMSV